MQPLRAREQPASCRCSLGGLRAHFTKNIASCDFFLETSGFWCCARHPAEQSSRSATEEGLSVPREPGYGSERSQDGEAKRTCSEPRPRRAEANVRRRGTGSPDASTTRKTSHRAIFSWKPPVSGAALGILPSSLLAARPNEGLPVPREPGYGSERSLEGEAKRTCSEPRPRWPRRTSGDGARTAPTRRLHEKHRILRFFLGNLRFLVLRSASCRAVFSQRNRRGAVRAPRAGLWERAQPGGRSEADMQ